jgi:hypothetical protein
MAIPGIHLTLSVAEFLTLELVGAAALALWVVARFPRIGPRSLPAAGVAVVAGFVLLELGSAAVSPATRMYGAYVALFGCVLPAFFAPFLSLAWLMRLLASSLGGSGGGGLRTPVADRG